jgi:hypothetical protein
VCWACTLAQQQASKPSPITAQGIGRTGTFCAIDSLLQRLDGWEAAGGGAGPDRSEVEAALDVPALVAGLRAQRMGMVQVCCEVGMGGGGDARVACADAVAHPHTPPPYTTRSVPTPPHHHQTLEQYVFIYGALLDDMAERLDQGATRTPTPTSTSSSSTRA